jgi:hypothetical protein
MSQNRAAVQHYAKTASAKAMACGRYLALDMVKNVREWEALAARVARSRAMFNRAEALAAALRRDLERCAMLHAVMARDHLTGVRYGRAFLIRRAKFNPS